MSSRHCVSAIIIFLNAAQFIFFFFQAEDGIRYGHVTGVQTCARPILRGCAGYPRARRGGTGNSAPLSRGTAGSEERRVGKSVDLGGRRIIKKKKEKKKIKTKKKKAKKKRKKKKNK